ECAMIARPPLKFAALKCPEATLLANLVRPKCKSQCVRATKKTLLSKLRTFTRKCQPQCVHSSKGTWRRRTRSMHTASALVAAFENWEASLDAAGQGVIALNRKITDIAGRNI